MKSERTKALSIDKKIKPIIWERDNHRCVICNKRVDNPYYANSHYISRAHGGLGIEQNIMTNCPACHLKWDNCKSKEEKEAMRSKIVKHFKSCYPGWNEADLVYKKYGTCIYTDYV